MVVIFRISFLKLKWNFHLKGKKKIIGALYTILTFYLLTILLHLNRKTSEYIYNTYCCFQYLFPFFKFVIYFSKSNIEDGEKKFCIPSLCLKGFFKMSNIHEENECYIYLV